MKSCAIFAAIYCAAALCVPAFAANLPLEKIQLPPGFKIEIFADGIPYARQMALGSKGTVFVGTRKGKGKVYAVRKEDYNKKGGFTITDIVKSFRSPNGVAFRNGTLYIAEISRIWKIDNIEEKLDKKEDLSPTLLFTDLPNDGWHGWKYIRFGPDGKLYVPVGAPCNVCERDDMRYASILRMNIEKRDLRLFASGVRNTVGFDWHPQTNEFWFTDNGRDMLGDDLPPDELNHAPQPGLHFGFPYCHGGDIPDPEFGEKAPCDQFKPPAQKLGPHVASLGMRFYTGEMFPQEYQNQIFIAEHGSWNRSKKIGYRVSLVTLNGNKGAEYKPFAKGWLQDEQVWGRPVDLLVLPDGSLLVSDDHAGVLYRISYEKSENQ